MKQQHQDSEVTIGLDLGDRRHRFCALDSRGEVLEEGSLLNDRASLARLTAGYRGALAVMEAGAHSPWVSRYLKRLGWEVIVSCQKRGVLEKKIRGAAAQSDSRSFSTSEIILSAKLRDSAQRGANAK
jgi:hypothetical protein